MIDPKDVPHRDRHPASPTDGEEVAQTLERLGETHVRMHLEFNSLPEYLILPARLWLRDLETSRGKVEPGDTT